MFNTLKYAKKLEDVGVPRKQAEVHIEIIADIVEDDMATKEDLRQLGTHLDVQLKDQNVQMKDLNAQVNAQIKDLKNDMAKLEYRMIIKLGTIVTVALAAFASIVKFF